MKHAIALLAFVALATSAAFADPVADVTAANAKFATVTTYRTTAVQPDGKTMKGETVNPDRTRMTMGPMEMISIGDTTYMKMGGGAWQKMPGSGMATGLSTLTKVYGKLPPTAVVRDLGMKTVDGESLHAYSVQQSPTDQPATMYINGDGLPSRIEVKSPRGTMVMQFYDFNAPISIAAPN